MQGSARKDVVFGQRGCILSPYQGQNGNPGYYYSADIHFQRAGNRIWSEAQLRFLTDPANDLLSHEAYAAASR